MFKLTTTWHFPDYEDGDLIHYRECSHEVIDQMAKTGSTDGEKEVIYLEDSTLVIRTFNNLEAVNEYKDWVVRNAPPKYKVDNVIEEIV